MADGVACRHRSTTSRRSRRCTPTAGAAAIAASTPTRTSTTTSTAERLRAWTERFADPRPDQRTVLAMHDGELVGFVHTLLDDDPRGARCSTTSTSAPTGSAIGSGAGSWPPPRARSSTSGRAAACTSGSSSATPAPSAFYAARGGAEVERAEEAAPDGTPTVILRVAWPDPTTAIPVKRGRRATSCRHTACGAPHPPASAGPAAPPHRRERRSLQSPAPAGPSASRSQSKHVTCDTLTMRHFSPYCLI